MKKTLFGATVVALAGSSVCAGGLDRSGQSVSAIFAADNSAALSFGVVLPSVTGTDRLGNSYDVGKDYAQIGLSYTNSIGENLNYAVILDQPYGADVLYNNDPTTSTLGGTKADLSSTALTFVLRYRIGARFSVFGGIGAERIDAEVALNGQAYANSISAAAVTSGFNASLPAGAPQLATSTLGAALAGDPAAAASIDGTYGSGTTAALGTTFTGTVGSYFANGGYDFRMADTTSPVYLLGAAYEVPTIGLRIAGTYRFETSHKADTTETFYGRTTSSSVDFVSPQSFNLEAQTGIAEGTLLTLGYRWTDFSKVDVVPTALGSDLVNLDDSHRFSIGLARRFSDKLAGSITYTFEPEGNDRTVSPLSPTDGLRGLSIGARYSDGPLSLSGGINYSILGDADAGVADVSQAEFRDMHVVGIGFKAEMKF